eukprot:TRINITY_DN44848_c0_g1_i1.p1 TRINITY_DN44848_c0_g1~~TRINITY_DN44848_c0_g1_i1.p1  ORF type:complete len:233 (+),score=41.07 TRINITY_DN44848_c0_g1_i1:84-782(+)
MTHLLLVPTILWAGLVYGQDPATLAATMMAGKVASSLASKAEETIEDKINQSPAARCLGPECCAGSSCMNVPGMSCHDNRGTTTCVGSSAISMTEGMCRCVSGACNEGGFCSDAPPVGGVYPGTGAAAPAATASADLSQPLVTPPPVGAPRPLSSQVLNPPPSGTESAGVPLVPVFVVGALIAAAFALFYVWESRQSSYETDDEEAPGLPLVAAKEQQLKDLYPGRRGGQGH